MKAIRFIVPLMLLALSTAAYSLDQDMEALVSRLAAQEARMADQDSRINDLHAKLASGSGSRDIGAVEGVLSLRKNAVVTVGGVLNTRYKFHNAKIENNQNPAGEIRRVASAKLGNFHIADANLMVQVDVNEHFDAFLNIDLQNGAGEDYGNAKAYYVRWKNICQSGFGLKVGRDALVFGEGGVGVLGSYAAGGGDGLGSLDFDGIVDNPILAHNGWDRSGILQATPYWEGMDGKVKLELSFMQNTWNNENHMSTAFDNNTLYRRFGANGVKFRSRNYGIGTMSFRAVVEPIEGLKLSGSVVNYHSNGIDGLPDVAHNKNNLATAFALNYRPAFCSKLQIWGQWVRGWNVDNLDGYDSDAINYGVAYDLTDALTVFAQGDYLNARWDNGGYRLRGKALAWYGGLMYDLGYGVTLEAGWKHERADHHDSADYKVKGTSDTIYGHLGFEF